MTHQTNIGAPQHTEKPILTSESIHYLEHVKTTMSKKMLEQFFQNWTDARASQCPMTGVTWSFPELEFPENQAIFPELET